MCQTGQCSQGTQPYLAARTAVGMHQSIHLVYRRIGVLSIKKETYTSLFLFCNSGITRLRVWIPTKQQYSQTGSQRAKQPEGVWIPTKQQYSQTCWTNGVWPTMVWIPTKQQYSQTRAISTKIRFGVWIPTKQQYSQTQADHRYSFQAVWIPIPEF